MTESAISIFRKLPETKTEVSNYSRLIKDAVLEGETEPLLFLQQITSLELLVKTLKTDPLIKDVILEEAEKYGKSFEHLSSKFQIKETGVKYDFSQCGDVEWEQLDSQIKDLTDKRKKRESFLKAIDGEVYGADGVQLTPPAKSSTTQVVITLNK